MSIDFFDDIRIQLLTTYRGADGVYFVMGLLARIYKYGYYCKWDSLTSDIIMSNIHSALNDDTSEKIVRTLLEYDFFDKNQYETNGILTASQIQKVYALNTDDGEILLEYKLEY